MDLQYSHAIDAAQLVALFVFVFNVSMMSASFLRRKIFLHKEFPWNNKPWVFAVFTRCVSLFIQASYYKFAGLLGFGRVFPFPYLLCLGMFGSLGLEVLFFHCRCKSVLKCLTRLISSTIRGGSNSSLIPSLECIRLYRK